MGAGSITVRERTTALPVALGQIVAGKDVPLEFPLDHAYKSIFVKTNLTLAQMKTALDRLTIEVNATQVWDIDFAEYLESLEAEGYQVQDGIIPIVFGRITEARTVTGEDDTIMGTLGLKSFNARIRLKASPAGDGVDFTRVTAVVLPNFAPTNLVTYKSRTTTNFDSGENTYDNIGMEVSDGNLMALHFNTTDISKMSVTYRAVRIHEDIEPAELHEQRINQVLPKPVVTGYTHLDFTQNGRLGSLLEAEGGKLSLKLTMGSAGSVSFVERRLISFKQVA